MTQKDYTDAGTHDYGTGDKKGGVSLMSHIQDINQDFKEEETKSLAARLGVSYVHVLSMPVNPEHVHLLPEEIAVAEESVPFYALGKNIKLAIGNPDKLSNNKAVDFLVAKGLSVEKCLVTKEGLQFLKSYYAARTDRDNIMELEGGNESGKTYEEEVEDLSGLVEKLDSLSENELLQKILVGGVSSGASDIHIQPEKNNVVLRFRIDGLLHTIFHMPSELYDKVLTKIKFVAGMKLNIGYKPQDGKVSFQASGRRIDVRVSTLPTEYGESLVMRLLDSKKAHVDIEALGFSEVNRRFLLHAIEKTEGMILVTGPTGSGKTTTLYGLLSKLNTPETKIITLEDPIEYQVEGISQSQIHESEGYTFALGLRAILRQDPNVIMLGEIRDVETASIAVQSSLTGHIVLSTVHANSAVESIARMLNMNVERYLLAPSLNLLTAQRLARKACLHCATHRALSDDERDLCAKTIQRIQAVHTDFTQDIPSTVIVPVGCKKCSNSGYLGQVACTEIVEVGKSMRDLILSGATEKELRREALDAGMITMREDGMLKVMSGVTTFEEVYRVTEER